MTYLFTIALLILSATQVFAQSSFVAFHDDMHGPYSSPFQAGLPQPIGTSWVLRFNDCHERVVPMIKYGSSSNKAAIPDVNAQNYWHPRPDGLSWWAPTYPNNCRRLYTGGTAAPLSPDVTVEGNFEVEAGSSNRPQALAARVSEDGRTMYQGGWYIDTPSTPGTCYIQKVLAGVTSNITAMNDCGAVKIEQVGMPAKFTVQGNALTLWINGVQRLQTTDSSITTGGHAGFAIGNWRVSSDETSMGGGVFSIKITDHNGVPQQDPPVTRCTTQTGSQVTATEAGSTYTVPLSLPLNVGQGFDCEKVQP